MAKAKGKPDKTTPEETPFRRFERALKQIIAVPKATLDKREQEWRDRKARGSS